MRIFKSHPLFSLLNAYLIDSPEPSNISYLWNFGSLLGFCLIIQIVTGVTLTIYFGIISIKIFTFAFNLFIAEQWFNIVNILTYIIFKR